MFELILTLEKSVDYNRKEVFGNINALEHVSTCSKLEFYDLINKLRPIIN